MKAKPGDRIICQPNTVGAPPREGEIKGTGPDGRPPYEVRWNSGNQTIFTPGSDTLIRSKRGGKRS